MINSLRPNQVFVFGSNLAGNHAGGAAKQAKESFGAKDGIPYGFQGQSFAIPTLDENMQKLPLSAIEQYLKWFVIDAKLEPKKEFLFTPIGTGIAGFSKEEMDSIMPEFPSNVIRV